MYELRCIYLCSLLLPSVWQYQSVLVMSLVLVIRMVPKKLPLLPLVLLVSVISLDYVEDVVILAAFSGIHLYIVLLCIVYSVLFLATKDYIGDVLVPGNE